MGLIIVPVPVNNVPPLLEHKFDVLLDLSFPMPSLHYVIVSFLPL